MSLTFFKMLGPAVLLAALLLACGGGGGITPPDDPPDDGDDPPVADVQGYAIYAVTLNNRLILFGSENPGTIARSVPISGLPFFNRIVGIDFRPSNGKLYGVGNDSRVYLLDPATGAATAVSPTPFQPKIVEVSDIHFGMGFDPATERIRLISAESGGNWSISPDDGTATTGMQVRYAAGDPNEGSSPEILGLSYTPLGAATAKAVSLRKLSASLGPQDLCEDLMWAIDARLAELIGSCDPDEGDFTSLGPLEGITGISIVFGCGELKHDPEGTLYSANLLRLPDGKLKVTLFRFDGQTGEMTTVGDIPTDSPLQAMAFLNINLPFQRTVRPNAATASLSMAQAAGGSFPATAGGGLASCTPAAP
jgi:hypothetical protein